jgi:hypothetical protein
MEESGKGGGEQTMRRALKYGHCVVFSQYFIRESKV